jgi:hypothetical protein
VSGGGRREFDLLGGRPPRWRPDLTDDQVQTALYHLFQGVGHDLGIQDIRDEAFEDYAGDQLCDTGMPMDEIDRHLELMRRRG